MAIKPALTSLWANFPDHKAYPTLADLYNELGGAAAKNVGSPGFGPDGNTCASRLSTAFNKSGAPIVASSGVSTLSTKDGSRIIYRVREFRHYLILRFGKPETDRTSPYNDAFSGRKGIIAFTVNWGDASGHIALWNGQVFREPTHDSYQAYVNGAVHTSLGEFWELP